MVSMVGILFRRLRRTMLCAAALSCLPETGEDFGKIIVLTQRLLVPIVRIRSFELLLSPESWQRVMGTGKDGNFSKVNV